MFKPIVATIAAMASATAVRAMGSDSVYGMSGMQSDMDNVIASLEIELEALEDLGEATANAFDAASGATVRVDGVVEGVADASAKMTGTLDYLEAQTENVITYDGLKEKTDKLISDAMSKVTEKKESLNGMATLVEEQIAAAGVEINRVTGEIPTKVAELTAETERLIEEAVGNLPFWGSEEHLHQVTGFYSNEIDKYWDGKAVVSSSDHGDVKGRIFYRVKYNVRTPGYWSGNSVELYMACAALSTYLRNQDGLERDLRPVCNHDHHQRFGGTRSCIWIRRSYFSHCGGGGYWRQNEACGGVPEQWLRQSVPVELNRHNNDRHLVHDGCANCHRWWDAYSPGQYQYTICTGGNQHYKTPPQ